MVAKKTTSGRSRKPTAEPDLSAIKIIPQSGKFESASQKTDSPKGVEYEERVVAFVDLLGFKEAIQRSAHKNESGRELLRRIHAALDIRIDGYAQAFAPMVDLQMSPSDFDERFHSFSDFIVMSVKRDICAIGLLIYAVFKICRELLSQGFASRGGIAMGDLYHRQRDPEDSSAPPMVFGPAFVAAYQFESAHADSPRVIMQNSVWQHIEKKCREMPASRLSSFLRTHVQRAEDGPAYVDIFADFGVNDFYKSRADLTTEQQAIHRHICAALDETADRPHQFKKNAQLAREFNQALEGAELHEHIIPRTKLPKRGNPH
ncbi:hypothetical protein [Paraburkholderia sp. MM6662-R1]|uniref:hypothetical protein n=1 Tax=Paraburkholderia sp. MM6662-R1 TaxID=2991066 RepID=UPI003D24E1BA